MILLLIYYWNSTPSVYTVYVISVTPVLSWSIHQHSFIAPPYFIRVPSESLLTYPLPQVSQQGQLDELLRLPLQESPQTFLFGFPLCQVRQLVHCISLGCYLTWISPLLALCEVHSTCGGCPYLLVLSYFDSAISFPFSHMLAHWCSSPANYSVCQGKTLNSEL